MTHKHIIGAKLFSISNSSMLSMSYAESMLVSTSPDLEIYLNEN